MAVMAPTGNSVGANHGARQQIRQHDDDRAADCGRGNQQAVVGAEKHAHHVGHEQADVADCAADRDGKPSQHGGCDIHHELHAVHD